MMELPTKTPSYRSLTKTKLDAPSESDGKPVIVMAPFTEGLYLFVSSQGDLFDGYQIHVGEGEPLLLTWDDYDATESKEVAISFHSTIEMHDGHVDYNPALWGFDDKFSVALRIPESVVQPNGSGTGDCNLAAAQAMPPWDGGAAYSPGDLVTGSDGVNYSCIYPHMGKVPPDDGYWLHAANMIVPAAGDGAYDLIQPVVVPYTGAGYWDYDKWEDSIAPSGTPGFADFMLFDFQLDDVPLIKNVLCGSHLGAWDLDPYKVEPIYPRWKFVFAATRADSGSRPGASIGGFYTCFRRSQ